MNCREMNESDLPECMEVEPRAWGDEIVGRDCAIKIWKGWVHSLSFNSIVVEIPGRSSASRIVAFGASVFLTAGFATRELEHPRPGLNGRVMALAASGRSVVLPEVQLCSGNAIDVAILACNYLYEAMNVEQTTRAETLLPLAFAESHVGYRINRIFIETVNERQRRIHESSGVWSVVAEYPEQDGALLVLTEKEAFKISGSVAAPLFQYHEPVLHLCGSEKQLLAQAMNGETDNELAAGLNLSLPTIKKRWLSVFDKVASVRPDLLPAAALRDSQESRGPQKRHHILAYLRSHPEELRPCRWQARMNF